MGTKISICGKGGSGKSTLTGLLGLEAVTRGLKVLIVDSDESNSGLYRTLGLEKPPIPLMDLVGGKKKLKGKMRQPNILNGSHISIDDIPRDYISERNGLGLVSIGKINEALEGCACPMGVLSREFLNKLKLSEKEAAFVDMEAGIEHFGRGIDDSIDSILLVVEPSYESIAIAAKIKALAGEMNKHLWAVINKVPSDDLAKKLKKELEHKEIEVIGAIPNDAAVFEAGLKGTAFSPCQATRAAGKILEFCQQNTGG